MLTSLREVAKDARITIRKAHLYMVSFSPGGFVTQTADYSYELGPLVMTLAKAQRLMAQTTRHFHTARLRRKGLRAGPTRIERA
ncbi:hypothetical protein Cthiooxydans_46810 [Comamonas thiooxydans]|nr:hypothetical protein Cthiooxydans_46810 [Comamonas thiooxydans]